MCLVVVGAIGELGLERWRGGGAEGTRAFAREHVGAASAEELSCIS